MHPEAAVSLIEPWAFEPGAKNKAFAQAYDSDSEGMLERISQCCSGAAATAEIERIAAVGDAFFRISREFPEIKLTADGESAGESGKYLASLVLYREIFGEIPSETEPESFGISAEEAKLLRSIMS